MGQLDQIRHGRQARKKDRIRAAAPPGAGRGAGEIRENAMGMQFEKISLDGQDEYLRRLAESPQKASDYSFVNVWGWAENYGLEWAFSGDLVWLRQTRPETVYWAPVGDWTAVDWGRAELPDNRCTMIRVPEKLAEHCRDALGAETVEARDHWDYIYDVRELIDLSGNRFHKKKNLVNQFVKKNEYKYHSMSMDCVEQALVLQDAWCEWRDCESSETLIAENEAIYRVLANWDRLEGVYGGVVEVGEDQVAYTVAEKLTEDTVVIHFEKARTEYKGAYQAINKLFLENDAGEFKYVNREQDLGDEGLRKAKESYNPIGYLKKFSVELAR
jgi:hypothetical protein